MNDGGCSIISAPISSINTEALSELYWRDCIAPWNNENANIGFIRVRCTQCMCEIFRYGLYVARTNQEQKEKKKSALLIPT